MNQYRCDSDCPGRAFLRTLHALGAFPIINFCQIILKNDGIRRTDLFTDPASYATDFAVCPNLPAAVPGMARHLHGAGGRDQLYDIPGTCSDTFPAGGTLIPVNHCKPLFIHMNGIKGTNPLTGTEPQASIFAASLSVSCHTCRYTVLNPFVFKLAGCLIAVALA